MIDVDKLTVSYGKGLPDVISEMSFHLPKGEILNILGQNAVGKTTLLRVLVRDLQRYKGKVQVNGKDVRSYSIHDFAKIVGVVSTSYNTFQNLVVADYLVTGFLNQMTPFEKPKEEYYQKAYDVLKSFDKHELYNKSIDQLSSGERQIVMIARVLLQNPEVVIFDEPTANLDMKNQITVLNQIKRLSEQGYTVIVTSHNPGHAYSLGGKTLLMGKGKYIYGEISDVVTEENLSEYYELKVSMKEAESNKFMLFQSEDEKGSIQLIV